MNELIDNTEILKKGHFALVSGRHSNIYFNKRAISNNNILLKKVSKKLANLINKNVSVIVSPERGAVPFGSTVARILTEKSGQKVDFIPARKTKNNDFSIDADDKKKISGANIIIVEDVLTTGQSTAKAAKTIKNCGGNIDMVVGILDRSNGRAGLLLKVPIMSLLSLKAQDWEPKDCELCKKGVNINTDLGHGAGSSS